MRHGSLFSGIGGFDLAAQWMGWENVFHCEFNPFCQKILKHYWPDAESYGDITETDFTKWRGTIDILTGGFPCQPFSQAGKRKGKEDSRYLWPEMLRAIREIQPTWVVAENVYGIINQGRGLVFEQVCAEMENEGYQVQPYLLPACAINAPHRRDRFWFVAYPKSYSCGNEIRNERQKSQEVSSKRFNESISTTNSIRSRFVGYKKSEKRQQYDKRGYAFGNINGVGTWWVIGAWEKWPTQSGICRGNDGFPNRVDRIKALGNAVVPQVAYEIFKAIEQTAQLTIFK